MEIRKIAKLRSEVDGNTVYGVASVFDTETYIYNERTYEVMARSAFDGVLKDPQHDTVALVNHDRAQLLGRLSSGTLRLAVGSEGLEFEVDLPDTQVGRDTKVLLQRGDLNGCSFSFWEKDVETKTRSGGGTVRVHTNIERLLDVSIVTRPAYPGTTVKLRDESYHSFERDPRSRLYQAKFNLMKGRHV